MSSGVTKSLQSCKYLQVTRAAINKLLTSPWLLSEFLASAAALAQPPWANRQRLRRQHSPAGARAGSTGAAPGLALPRRQQERTKASAFILCTYYRLTDRCMGGLPYGLINT